MSLPHRSSHAHRHTMRTSQASHPLPFFEFMLYGAGAFAGAARGVRLAPAPRGRSLTLVQVPGVPPTRRGA